MCTVETGISNFHRMVLTIESRDYKHFDKDNFERDLVLALESNPFTTYSYDQFLSTFEIVLDKVKKGQR